MQNVGIQITAKDETAGAFKTVSGRLSSLGKDAAGAGETVGELMGKFTALGVAASAAISLIGFKAAVDTADAFSKMAQKTGVAVEQLRELNYAAALSDVSTEALGTGLRKLSINMAAAAGGGKEQTAIFAALGISVKDASGSLKGADTVLKEVAGQFANFKDGPEKAALAVQLFGKAGVDLIPLLNAGSSGLSEMAQEARDLGAVFSGELGKQAEAFNDNLTRIGIAAQRTGYAIATELLPTLSSLAESFINAQKASSGFGSAIGGFLKIAIETFVLIGSDVAFVLKTLKNEAVATVQQVVALAKLDFKGFSAISKAVEEDSARARVELDKFQYYLVNIGKAGAGRGTATDPRILFGPDSDPKTSAPIVKPAVAATAAQISDYEKLTKAIAEKTAVAKLDLATTEKLTDGQKLAEKFQSDLTLSTLKMTDAEVKSTRANIAGLIVVEQAIIAKDKATKRMVAEYEQEVEALKELSTAQVANDNARAAGITAVSTYADAIAEQNTYAQLELSLMGSTAVAREIALGQYRVELDLKKQIEAIDSNAGFDEDQRIVQRARARAAAAKAAVGVEAKAYTDEWKKTSDSINNSLTDALLRGFESGKDFAKNLRDTIVNMFKTMILRPIISAVMSPISGAITGAIGLSGAAQAAGAATGATGMFAGLAAGAASWGTAAGAGFMATVGGSTVAGAGAAGILATGGAAGAGTAGMLGGALGALGPAGWIALAALAAYAVFKGGETRSGASYVTGADGNAAFQMGPSGGEIAGPQARAMFNTSKSSLQSILTGVGSKGVLTGYVAGLESSENGRGFAYAGGKINGVGFGEYGGRDGGQFAMGNKTPQQAMAAYQLNLSQSILEGLQVTTDIPATVAKLITDGLNGGEIKDLSQEAVNAILASVEKVSGEVNTFKSAMLKLPFAALKNLSFDTAAGLIAAAGGFEKLDANLSGYYQNFYSAEEQRAQSITNTQASFAALGLTMPVLDDGARAAYRAMVEYAAAQDLSIEANRIQYTSLLALQGPMNQLSPSLDSAAESARNARNAYLDLNKATADAAKAAASAALDAAKTSANAAYATLERAVGAQRKLAEVALSVAQEQVEAVKSVFDTLKANVQSLYASVGNTSAMQAAQGNAFIEQALSTAQASGNLPDSAALAEAITAARAGEDAAIYASQGEADFSRLVFAGKLSKLQELAGPQLTAAQQVAAAAQSQIDSLDAILGTAKDQLDAAMGIDTRIMSVADAVNLVNDSVRTLIAVTASSATASRMASVKEYVQSVYDKSSATKEADSLKKISDTAYEYGVSMADVAKSMGFSLESVQALYKKFNVAWRSSIGVIGPGGMPAGPTTTPAPASPGDNVVTVGGGASPASPTSPAAPKSYFTATNLGGWGINKNYITDPARVAELDSINAYIGTVFNGSAASLSTIAATAGKYGVTQAQIAQATGYTEQDIARLFAASGIPAFATGGIHPGGLRLVGENGPELEATGPSRIFNASQTSAMLGGNNARLESLVEGLTKEVQRLQSIVNDGNKNTRRAADAVNGNPEMPMLVQAV